ncbi:MAG: UDP-N-acetylmuramoyl-L-alanine--D-glutamate ligase, partial [Flavobacteriales bacterium]
LDGIVDFRSHIAVLLNITPDHLDRYAYNMQNYVESKFRITMNQSESDHFIHCSDDPESAAWLSKNAIKAHQWPFSIQHEVPQGAFLANDHIHIKTNQTTFEMSMIELALKGKHNVYNSMAAGIAARVLEIRSDVIRESLSDFQNVEHRLEYVSMVHGVEFINDSKATNVNSAWYALESMTKPIVWVVGGIDKGNDYSSLMELVRERVKAIVCLGTDNTKLHEVFGSIVPVMVDTASAEQAVRTSYELAESGDVVLLSPCCSSFDLFENYEDRGRQFKSAVKGL